MIGETSMRAKKRLGFSSSKKKVRELSLHGHDLSEGGDAGAFLHLPVKGQAMGGISAFASP